MASTMASTLALSRPSEKLGTHSTSVDITDEDIGGRMRAQELTMRRWSGAGQLTFGEELAYAQAYLDCIEARIGRGQSCVRDVHVAEFHAQVVSLAENMRAQRGLVHKVHRIGSGGHVVIGEDHTAG